LKASCRGNGCVGFAIQVLTLWTSFLGKSFKFYARLY
jgi:hypothetical protein